MKLEITNAQVMSALKPVVSASTTDWANTIQSGTRLCAAPVALVIALGAYLRSIARPPMLFASAGISWLFSAPEPAVEPEPVKAPAAAAKKPVRRRRTTKPKAAPKASQKTEAVSDSDMTTPIVMTQEIAPPKPRTRAPRRTKAGFAV